MHDCFLGPIESFVRAWSRRECTTAALRTASYIPNTWVTPSLQFSCPSFVDKLTNHRHHRFTTLPSFLYINQVIETWIWFVEHNSLEFHRHAFLKTLSLCELKLKNIATVERKRKRNGLSWYSSMQILWWMFCGCRCLSRYIRTLVRLTCRGTTAVCACLKWIRRRGLLS